MVEFFTNVPSPRRILGRAIANANHLVNAPGRYFFPESRDVIRLAAIGDRSQTVPPLIDEQVRKAPFTITPSVAKTYIEKMNTQELPWDPEFSHTLREVSMKRNLSSFLRTGQEATVWPAGCEMIKKLDQEVRSVHRNARLEAGMRQPHLTLTTIEKIVKGLERRPILSDLYLSDAARNFNHNPYDVRFELRRLQLDLHDLLHDSTIASSRNRPAPSESVAVAAAELRRRTDKVFREITTAL